MFKKLLLLLTILLLPLYSYAASVAFVSHSGTGGTTSSLGSASINLAASSTLLVAVLATSSNSGTVSNIKFNGVSLSQYGRYQNNIAGGGSIDVWYMANPPTGSAYTLTWNFAASYTWAMDATWWSVGTQIASCITQYNTTALTWAYTSIAQQATSQFYSAVINSAATTYMLQTYTASETEPFGVLQSTVLGFADGYITGPAAGSSQAFSWIVSNTKITSGILMEINNSPLIQTATIQPTMDQSTMTIEATKVEYPLQQTATQLVPTVTYAIAQETQLVATATANQTFVVLPTETYAGLIAQTATQLVATVTAAIATETIVQTIVQETQTQVINFNNTATLQPTIDYATETMVLTAVVYPTEAQIALNGVSGCTNLVSTATIAQTVVQETQTQVINFQNTATMEVTKVEYIGTAVIGTATPMVATATWVQTSNVQPTQTMVQSQWNNTQSTATMEVTKVEYPMTAVIQSATIVPTALQATMTQQIVGVQLPLQQTATMEVTKVEYIGTAVIGTATPMVATATWVQTSNVQPTQTMVQSQWNNTQSTATMEVTKVEYPMTAVIQSATIVPTALQATMTQQIVGVQLPLQQTATMEVTKVEYIGTAVIGTATPMVATATWVQTSNVQPTQTMVQSQWNNTQSTATMEVTKVEYPMTAVIQSATIVPTALQATMTQQIVGVQLPLQQTATMEVTKVEYIGTAVIGTATP